MLKTFLFALSHKITQLRKYIQAFMFIFYQHSQVKPFIYVRNQYICVVNKLFKQMDFHQRLKQLRTEKGLSKGDLATLATVHYSQIGRYEEKGATPSADIMAKIANALGVSSDFLMNGSSNELADSSLTDKELLNQFKAIEAMQEDDKTVIKTLIDAFITKKKVQQLAK
jgi:transcriptional regulator with XRE-family HTH domain